MLKKLSLILCSLFLSACQLTATAPLPEVTPTPTEIPSITTTPALPAEASPSAAPKTTQELLNIKPTQKMYANIDTTQGVIKVELFHDKTPLTVANFIGLSEGTKDWTDPATGKLVSGRSLYAGTTFHRVIKDFMIQGGDPLGTGTGGPGYRFADEFDKKLSFAKAGMLAMANSGPGTNGSQFFITVVPTTWLDGKHTIFGQVTQAASQDIVNKIVSSPVDATDKPTTPVIINSITIERK